MTPTHITVGDTVRVCNGSGQSGTVVQIYGERIVEQDGATPYTRFVAVVCPPVQNAHYWLADHLERAPSWDAANNYRSAPVNAF